jgi:hypothetical protein
LSLLDASEEPFVLSKPRPKVGTFQQNVVFVGRTSGCSIGFVRMLRPCQIFYQGDKKLPYNRLFWSVDVLKTDRIGVPGGRPGDSSAWAYEMLTGRPVLMVVGGAGNTEALCQSLSDIFDDIERVTKYKPSLPRYDKDSRYNPGPDDDDLGLIKAHRAS